MNGTDTMATPVNLVSSARDRVNTGLRRVPVWLLYICAPLPAAYWFWQGISGLTGPEPIKVLEHALGLFGLQMLLVTLAVTPLRRYTGLNLLRFRRALGLISFLYVALHLLVWLVLDVGLLSEIWADIVKRPYITVGMAAFVLMLPLAMTSNNWSIRKLGRTWRQLHKLTYAVVLLGGLHFIMLRKGIQLEPLLYMAGALALLALRWPRRSAKR
jgi:sulfoxide reductase heme-binding subunit YedZ